jgi:hypothetical protein
MKVKTHHTIRLKGVPAQKVSIPYVLRRHQVNQVIRSLLKATRSRDAGKEFFMWSDVKKRFVAM